MYKNEHTLQDLLKKAYHRLDMDDTVLEMEVKRAYNSVVGDLIARLTQSLRYKEGTLAISMPSAALRQEMWYRRQSLAGRINDTLGRQAVHKIIFLA